LCWIRIGICFKGKCISEKDIPTFPFPLSSTVFEDKQTDSNKIISIFVENPFDVDVSAKLVQKIPFGIKILDSDSGSLQGDSLIWDFSLESKSTKE